MNTQRDYQRSSSGAHVLRIREDFAAETHSGVNGTPLFINGVRYNGAVEFEHFSRPLRSPDTNGGSFQPAIFRIALPRQSTCQTRIRKAPAAGHHQRHSVRVRLLEMKTRDMQQARLGADGVIHWVETCFCATPLAEERPYWEKYFELLSVKDAHNRKNCRHENGTEPWACTNCDCTKRMEERLKQQGKSFLKNAKRAEVRNSGVACRASRPYRVQAGREFPETLTSP